MAWSSMQSLKEGMEPGNMGGWIHAGRKAVRVQRQKPGGWSESGLQGAEMPGLLVEGREGGAAGPSDWAGVRDD